MKHYRAKSEDSARMSTGRDSCARRDGRGSGAVELCSLVLFFK